MPSLFKKIGISRSHALHDFIITARAVVQAPFDPADGGRTGPGLLHNILINISGSEHTSYF